MISNSIKRKSSYNQSLGQSTEIRLPHILPMIFERFSIRKIQNLTSICHRRNHLGDHSILIRYITPSLRRNPMRALDSKVLRDNITQNMSESAGFFGLGFIGRSHRNDFGSILWRDFGRSRNKLAGKG